MPFLCQALPPASSPTGGLVWDATEQFQAVEAGKNIVGGPGAGGEFILYINCTVIEKNVVRRQNSVEPPGSWRLQLDAAEGGGASENSLPGGTTRRQAVWNS